MNEYLSDSISGQNEKMKNFVQCFLTILQIQEINYDDKLFNETELNNAQPNIKILQEKAKKIKIKVKMISPSIDEIIEMENPLIARMKDDSYLVIGKSNARVMLVYRPETGKTETYKVEDFTEQWSGECIFIKKPFRLKEANKKFNLFWFIPVILKYKKYLLEVLAASFFLQLFGLVTPLFTQVIIDKVILHKGISTLDILAMALIFSAVFQCMMTIARKYIEIHTTNKVDMILGVRLFRHLTALPLRYFEVRRVGDTLTRVSALNSIRNFLTNSSMTVFLDTLFSVVFIAVMFYYSVTLTLIALIPLPLYILQNIIATPIYKERLNAVWESGARSNAFLVESITGVQTMKALAIEPQFNHQWENILAKYIKNTFDNAKFNIYLSASSGTIQSIMTFGILLVGGHQVMNGEMTIGQLIAFQMLARQASDPMHRLTGMWQSCQQTLLAVERLGDILNTSPELRRLNGQPMQSIVGAIRFEDVSFSYNAESQPIISSMNLQIKPGTRVGIVGRSGSGKSTITKLVQRLYMPGSGKVYIDEKDVMEIEPTWLRQQIGVVLQENFLFNGSVRDNIAFAKPGASIDEVIYAAKLAGAHDFILELSEGYDTKVGERGASLSGGQQQRIAIARAIITNPKILIFDEATSALDYESENIIMHNIDKIAAGRTMLMIAHRLSTVRNCDMIIVVDKGNVVEYGTHDELMAKMSLYYSLYMQQEV